MERKVVIPGEMIIEGEDYLPGDSTEKSEGKIYALRYGLAEESNNLIKVIPLSGVYSPRRGNVIIGKVENIISAGWFVDIGAPDNAFLSMMEVPRYVNKDAMEEVLQIGDMVIAKIWGISKRGIDLSLKSRGLGRVEEGIVFHINPNKVPRVIGKEGSMIKLIKENTGSNITVGQNGYVLIKGDNIDSELFAKRAIEFVVEKSFVEGLTDTVTKWFEEQKK
ncbi:S1 RNA-binding domain-containing protein [archaeon]|jgi:exosome complex component RRP4|nr:S1 RNA-binding domain-containing protein [archaeon]